MLKKAADIPPPAFFGDLFAAGSAQGPIRAYLGENLLNFQPYALAFSEKSIFFASFWRGVLEWILGSLAKDKVKLPYWRMGKIGTEGQMESLNY